MIKTHTRVFIRRLKTHLKKRGWIYLAVFLAISMLSNRYHLAINRTHSLPQKLFVIERGNQDVEVGDYVAFYPKKSATGGYRLEFIKEVACKEGQKLEQVERVIYCDGKEIAKAKPVSLKGEPLIAISSRVLGEDEFFVRGTHPDSYDSRYDQFGLIDRCRLVGKALPVF